MPPMRIAFGPVAPAFGSWEWIGADLGQALDTWFCETTFFTDVVPASDVVVFVKFKPAREELAELKSKQQRLIFCPVDGYGSAADIDADADSLRCFDQIVIHCERLRRYISPYAPVAYLDHHLKFHVAPPTAQHPEGPLLWIGNRSNLPPVAAWLNRQHVPGEVWILTDFPTELAVQSPAALGFASASSIRIGRWTPERHREWTSLARAAFDVKGDDFRARHKPPTKALDYLASGVPLAMNPDSSSTEHLQQQYGFRIASLADVERWLSRDYWEAIQHLAPQLKAELSLPQVARRFQTLLTSLR